MKLLGWRRVVKGMGVRVGMNVDCLCHTGRTARGCISGRTDAAELGGLIGELELGADLGKARIGAKGVEAPICIDFGWTAGALGYGLL